MTEFSNETQRGNSASENGTGENNSTENNSTDNSTGRKIFIGALIGVILFSVFAIGVGVGLSLQRVNGGSLFASSPNATSSDTRTQIEAKFGTFWEAMNVVYRDFYGDLPTPQNATYAAIRGVVDSLNDPHTSFLTPDEANQFRSNITGEFEGIGSRVDWDKDEEAVRIVEPYENQPAWNAGLRRDDLVIAIDGESTKGSDLAKAIEKIRGPKGSSVTLRVKRAGVIDPFDVIVTRDRIEIPTIESAKVGPNGEIGYVKLFTFNENAGQLVRQAVEDALKDQPRALIFDLRGNSGGLLREAVKVTNVFVQDQTVVIERFKDGRTESYKTEEKAIDSQTKLIVLVNEGSASASEIVAGALQDLNRAKLLGVKTFGKGSVQLPQNLSDNSIVRVTVARWFTPNDRTIDGKGLEPDIVVELSDADREADKDPQLDAAVAELLK